MNDIESRYPCPKYEKAATALLAKVNKASSLAEIRKLFLDFAKKYTVIDYLWRQWLLKELDSGYKDYKASQRPIQFKKIKALAQTHFYHYIFLDFDYESFEKGKFGRAFCWCYMNEFEVCKVPSKSEPFTAETLYSTLVYPHGKLGEFKCFTEKYSVSPIPKKLLQRFSYSQSLFEEIRTKFWETKDILSGLKCLQNTSKVDQKLVEENFECALGMITCNKNVWRTYITYLKKRKEDKKLLNLFSKFFRLFIDDSENEYQFELERQNEAGKDVSKWWIDFIEIKKDFGGINAARMALEKALSHSTQEILVKYGLWFEKEYGSTGQYMSRHLWATKLYPHLQNLYNIPKQIPTIKARIGFTYKIKNFLPKYSPKLRPLYKREFQPPAFQNFSLPSTIIYYLQKAANPSISLKLHMSGKYFFLLQKSPLCHNLTILEGAKDNPIYHPQSLFITSNHSNHVGLSNLTVTNSLIVYPRNAPNLFSNLLAKINLKIKHVDLALQRLNLAEFNVLSKLNLKSLKFNDVKIVKNDENIMLSVDEILLGVPAVSDFSILNGFFTQNTSKQLSALQRKIKLNHLNITRIDANFLPDHFITFLTNNAISHAKVEIEFESNITEEQRLDFDASIKEHLPSIKFKRN